MIGIFKNIFFFIIVFCLKPSSAFTQDLQLINKPQNYERGRIGGLLADLDNDSIFYSLSYHDNLDANKNLDTNINSGFGYFRLSKLDKKLNIIKSVHVLKNNYPVTTTIEKFREKKMFIASVIDSFYKIDIWYDIPCNKTYIFYFNQELVLDSFLLKLPNRENVVNNYLITNDSIVSIYKNNVVENSQLYILFSDTIGNYLSHKKISFGDTNIIYVNTSRIIKDGKGGYIIAATRDSLGWGKKKYLFGMDALGNKTWEYIEPTPYGRSEINEIILQNDETIICCGYRGEYAYLGKFSIYGKKIWEKLYYLGNEEIDNGRPSAFADMLIKDNFLYLSGYGYDKIFSKREFTDASSLVKMDLSGKPIWLKRYTNYYYYNIINPLITLNDRFILGGFCIDSTLNPPLGVPWFISCDTNYNFIAPWCSTSEIKTYSYDNPSGNKELIIQAINFYPNPAFDKLYVSNANDIKEIYIYDLLGKLVKQMNMVNSKTKESEIAIDDLTAGIYIIQVVDVYDAKLSSKFIKE
ncbi:MAG: T9SS type A sorting domain-containing protein [Bacteroidia bacterium]